MAHKEGGVIDGVHWTFFHTDTFCVEQFLGDLIYLSRAIRFGVRFSSIIVGALCAAAPPCALVAVGSAGLAHTVLYVSKVVGNQVRARPHAHTAVIFNPEERSLA